MASRSSTRSQDKPARRRSRLPEAAEPRMVSLDVAQERYIVAAVLRAEGTLSVEQLASLYWSVRTLDPMSADFDDEVLIAHFERYAPTADLAAWEVARDIQALPGAELKQVEAGRAGRSRPEVVLLSGSPDRAADRAVVA